MKIKRLLKIIVILMNRNGITVKYLAEQFEVSKKTIYRDLETLIISGIPVCYGEDHRGIVYIMEGYSFKYAFLPDRDNNKKMFDIEMLSNVSEDTSDEVIEVYSQAWQTFISQKTFNTELIKSEITQSWTRCQRADVPINYVGEGYLLDPKDAKLYTVEHLDVYQDENFRTFERVVKNLSLDISIFDQQGQLKYIFNYNKMVETLYPRNGYVLDASELAIGTNSTGLAIIENMPVMVIGPEHYNQIFHKFSCCAAPIYKDNQLIGTVNASFMHTSLTNRTLNVLYSLARLYESLIVNHSDELPIGVIEKSAENMKEKSLFENFVGVSNQWKVIKQTARSLSKVDIPILISGEQGIGKSLLGKCMHFESMRKDGPCIEFDCLSIPNDLLKISLFGYEGKNNNNRTGAFGEAVGGSLILSNIEVLPLPLQKKLYTYLRTNKIKSSLSNKLISYDLRLIICTRGDNLESIYEPLLKLIDMVQIKIPPLRERKEDIQTLIAYYAKSMSIKFSMKPIDAATIVKLLVNREWVGNVKELFNHMDKLVVLDSDFTE